jgi:hypothetical protein
VLVIARSLQLGLSVASLGALIACLSGCEASISTEPKTEARDDWAEPTPVAASAGPDQRAVSGRPPTATYPGYRVVDGDRTRSMVLVEVSRNVEVTQQRAEGRLIYVIHNTAVPERVNRLPLIADEFGTVVSRISLEQAGPDAFLVIETRSKVEATHRVVSTDNGVNVEVAITGPAWNYGRWAASDDRPGYQPTAPQGSEIQR